MFSNKLYKESYSKMILYEKYKGIYKNLNAYVYTYYTFKPTTFTLFLHHITQITHSPSQYTTSFTLPHNVQHSLTLTTYNITHIM